MSWFGRKGAVNLDHQFVGQPFSLRHRNICLWFVKRKDRYFGVAWHLLIRARLNVNPSATQRTRL